MIEHVYRRTAGAAGVDAVIVATDDERIAAAVERFGGTARMTSAEHRTGTDRIAAVVRDLPCEIVVNVQGDLPLLEPDMIVEAIEPLERDATLPMSTLRRAIEAAAEYHNPNVVKVVVNRHGDAMYFSRAAIPHIRAASDPAATPALRAAAAQPAPTEAGRHEDGAPQPVDAGRSRRGTGDPAEHGNGAATVFSRTYKHIGLYAYRREFLLTFAGLPPTALEQAESLEQLRALEHGFRIGTAETRHESIEVDTPEDLERVRRSLAVARA